MPRPTPPNAWAAVDDLHALGFKFGLFFVAHVLYVWTGIPGHVGDRDNRYPQGLETGERFINGPAPR